MKWKYIPTDVFFHVVMYIREKRRVGQVYLDKIIGEVQHTSYKKYVISQGKKHMNECI